MKLRILFNGSCLLVSCLLANSAFAELYKWVGADGKVTYSDIPPPANAKRIETKSISSDAPGINLPPELATAVAQNPVTLYVAPSCIPCNDGRVLLKQLGIPFSEKTVITNEDINKLKQISGDTQLPLLLISNSKFRGFDSAEWRTTLSSAGYPETNKLPKDYRYPAAEPAAPVPPPAVKKEVKKTDPEPKPKQATESGIRF
ncbi:MAG: glutaredoxin family protein [Undibacterium sp.]|uniref:glutaredoxin family protein n=1 Tax=Undibacterium sp. TaxID=1914977 RepID=UPI0027189A05|nr:glutaredoxin family protein [Undibacterium sp.]MDO8652404.1 glutaredoxin family protein [Undibacterium sp.]